MQAETERFVAELIAAWNSHDARRVARFYADCYEGSDIGQVAPMRGPDEVCDYFERFYTAFPDVQLTVDSVVNEADRYAIAWTAHGTHQGKLMNIPPSGKPVAVRSISVLTTEAGKVVRALTVWDMAGMLRAIGLLPRLSR